MERVEDPYTPPVAMTRLPWPVVWNSLPEDIRIPELLLEPFKSMLKTHLFRQAYA